MNLWKTTLVIWSEFDPQRMEIETMAYEATEGAAYCSGSKVEHVKNAEDDPDWDGTEFFETTDWINEE